MSLSDIEHWVFDMDGTLTIAVHDFAAIREALSIPAEDDILTHLAALPADESAAKHAWLLEHGEISQASASFSKPPGWGLGGASSRPSTSASAKQSARPMASRVTWASSRALRVRMPRR